MREPASELPGYFTFGSKVAKETVNRRRLLHPPGILRALPGPRLKVVFEG